MRRTSLFSLLLLLVAATMLPATGSPKSPVVYMPPGPGSVISENVTYVATLAIESPGIGAKVVKVGNQVRFYTTGAKGLTIYDVTNPALPLPLGAYHLPHFQNEDVDVSADGSRVIISTDTASADRSGSASNGIHVLDTTNPLDIKRTAFIANSNHTTTCADAKCEWLYGSNGRIYDATQPGSVVDTGRRWGGGGHALNLDSTGIMISDSTPRLILDVTDPAFPVVLASGRHNGTDGLLQHNNVRPRAEQWEPRDPESPDYEDPALRPGELFMGNSESNVRPQCNSTAGGFSTWSMQNFNEGQAPRQLEVLRPVNGTWANGNPAANALGCSGHWFTVRDMGEKGFHVAAAWYEHGIRFLHVNPTDGKITQKGFFQPVVTEAGAAHWIDDEYVYTTDYARGVDILRFNKDAEAPSPQEIEESWKVNLGKVGMLAALERFACHRAMKGIKVA